MHRLTDSPRDIAFTLFKSARARLAPSSSVCVRLGSRLNGWMKILLLINCCKCHRKVALIHLFKTLRGSQKMR